MTKDYLFYIKETPLVTPATFPFVGTPAHSVADIGRVTVPVSEWP